MIDDDEVYNGDCMHASIDLLEVHLAVLIMLRTRVANLPN